MKDGFFDIHPAVLCNHPEHIFPSMLYIPSGKGYKHTCPNCGKVTIAYGSNITL